MSTMRRHPSRSKPHRIGRNRSQNSQNARCIPAESRRLRVSSCKSMCMMLTRTRDYLLLRRGRGRQGRQRFADVRRREGHHAGAAVGTGQRDRTMVSKVSSSAPRHCVHAYRRKMPAKATGGVAAGPVRWPPRCTGDSGLQRMAQSQRNNYRKILLTPQRHPAGAAGKCLNCSKSCSEIQTAAELPVKRIPRRRSVASRLAAGVESTI